MEASIPLIYVTSKTVNYLKPYNLKSEEIQRRVYNFTVTPILKPHYYYHVKLEVRKSTKRVSYG
jgi:hypothetical protein